MSCPICGPNFIGRCSHLPQAITPRSDSIAGFDRMPDRYSLHGRETIDRIRDELGDDGFIAFCLGNAMKYADRSGLKGSAAEDNAKHAWYMQMAMHVEDPESTDDPRSSRPGFKPYVRHE